MDRRVALLGVVLVAAFSLAGSAAVEGFLQVTINEVELNPVGRDAGKEWVELLNISDEDIDLAGWMLTYNYRSDGLIMIAETELLLRPGERHIFTYPELMLRNDDNTVIELLSPDGIVVDRTPTMNDEAGDGQTWQRYPDGGDPLFLDFWIMGDGTKNAPNE